MFVGSKVRPVRGADNLTAIYEPIVQTIHATPNVVLRQITSLGEEVRRFGTQRGAQDTSRVLVAALPGEVVVRMFHRG
jgi:hypothetical protein